MPTCKNIEHDYITKFPPATGLTASPRGSLSAVCAIMNMFIFAARWAVVGLSFGAIALLAQQSTLWANLFGASPTGYSDAVRRAAPAVVSINAVTRTRQRGNPLTGDPLFQQFFGAEGRGDGTQHSSNHGSGVILDPSGVVLTNYHVIRDSDAIRISLHDGRAAFGRIIGIDPDTDLAVLKIELEQLPSIALGDSDALKVGDIVLAIGNALGIGQTVTQGIVSATGRNRIGINTFENFIQTDAAINFGNSGGALINGHGDLIGINSVRVDSEGIGFAIPTSIAIPIARQILDSGSVERGGLGIDARDLSDSLKQMLGVERGIVVLDILADGPGDLLTQLGNDLIGDSRAAIKRIAASKPGSRIALHAVRDGTAYVTMVTVSRRPPPPRE